MDTKTLMETQFQSKDLFVSGCRNLTEVCMMILYPTKKEIDKLFKPLLLLTESDSQLDLYYLQKIEELYQKLIKALDVYKIKKLSVEGKVNINIDNIKFTLIKDTNSNLDGSFNKDTNTINLYIPKILIDRWLLTGIPDLSFIKATLLHEIVHDFDINMIQGKGSIVPPPADYRKRENYYNHSLEFNAYSLQLINILENYLDNKDILTYEMNKLSEDDLEPNRLICIKILNNMLNDVKYRNTLSKFKIFISYLTDTNKKKLYKRIYEYFLNKELTEWHN